MLYVFSFVPNGKRGHFGLLLANIGADADGESKAWQRDVDTILDIDTDCDSRRDLVFSLFGKISEIAEDVSDALLSGDVKKVAPPSLAYGKAVEGLEAVQRQLVSDVIPDLISKGPAYPLEVASELRKQQSSSSGTDVGKLIDDVQSFANDPSRIQNTANALSREVRNVFKSIPEGLESPAYTAVTVTANYELRDYESYAVCRTTASANDNNNQGQYMGSSDPLMGGQNFNVLAGYIFGDNEDDEEMSMTTPVVTQGPTMEFVLARGFTEENAPQPRNDKVKLATVPARRLAVRRFPGLATAGEVSRQRAALEDALLADGIDYDNLTFRVATFNPPYTLPWLRVNEVSLEVAMPITSSNGDRATEAEGDAVYYESSPEAGE